MTGVTVKLMARGVFSGELNPDPESAAADLRRAGYEVFMMPDKRPLLPSSLSVGYPDEVRPRSAARTEQATSLATPEW